MDIFVASAATKRKGYNLEEKAEEKAIGLLFLQLNFSHKARAIICSCSNNECITVEFGSPCTFINFSTALETSFLLNNCYVLKCRVF